MKPTMGQQAIAANAEHAVQNGKAAIIFAGGFQFRLTEVSADRNDENEIEWLTGMDANANEIFIDITQVVALMISDSQA